MLESTAAGSARGVWLNCRSFRLAQALALFRAIQLSRITDPGPIPIVELVEVDREALPHRQLSIDRHKSTAVMGVIATAPFAHIPHSASDRGAQHRRRLHAYLHRSGGDIERYGFRLSRRDERTNQPMIQEAGRQIRQGRD